jgi:hypothetical protein
MVESSTFGSEFVACRTVVERIKALRHKLRMFGVPIEGPTNICCDNESVVKCSSLPEAQLMKKHNMICYAVVREAAAADWIRVGYEPSESNVADLFTKMLSVDQRKFLLGGIFPRN